MKVAIFGSTGSVGKHAVEQALAEGHEVTAFARSPEKLGDAASKVHVARGDVLDLNAVKETVRGQDAVVCALGMPLMNGEGLRARGTRNIVEAMEMEGVKRLVCLSVLGAGDSMRTLPWHYRYLIVPLMLRRVIADHAQQEAHIRASNLNWTLARPPNIVEGGATGEYRHGLAGELKRTRLKVSRGDVAQFLLRQLKDSRYLLRAPVLSY